MYTIVHSLIKPSVNPHLADVSNESCDKPADYFLNKVNIYIDFSADTLRTEIDGLLSKMGSMPQEDELREYGLLDAIFFKSLIDKMKSEVDPVRVPAVPVSSDVGPDVLSRQSESTRYNLRSNPGPSVRLRDYVV
ncbi:hypothetical protein NDU88_004651 [Pleurodeles waltl]|uniref:Uncharacterized protein n=1 Tax=Pleurodeles waltl TaxID=8319 RepID=A0AAV7MU48_PLEWA|nr:hypothetical protein NDU88_004651 [Pleurodeles waltl]